MVLFKGAGKVFDRLHAFLALVTILYFIGFAFFWASFPEVKPSYAVSKEKQGLVVFTGGSKRINYAFDHLRNGYAQPVLITGVFEKVSKRSLLNPLEEPFKHLVTVDYTAQTTRDNIVATSQWLSALNLKDIVLITSHYHVPRSLLLLNQAGFKGQVQVYPVVPEKLPLSFLFREYTKYLLAMVHVI